MFSSGVPGRSEQHACPLDHPLQFRQTARIFAENQPTEADAIAVAKEPPAQIGIFTPEQMTALLENAGPQIVPYLAIGGFDGLRHAELMRLDWSEIKLKEGHIKVVAQKAETAQRRIVPMQDNLAKWLARMRSRLGGFSSGTVLVS